MSGSPDRHGHIRLRVVPSDDGSGAFGVQLQSPHAVLEQRRPLAVSTVERDVLGTAYGYSELVEAGGGLVGTGSVPLGEGAFLEVSDTWSVDHDSATVRVARTATVRGSAPGAFMSRLSVRRSQFAARWPDVEPFIPGVAYGNARQVPAGALGGWPTRASGDSTVLVREDRASAPLVAVRYADGAWMAALHTDPDGARTVAADCVVVEGGETLVDPRLRFGSVGGRVDGDVLELGLWFPGTEGERTYSSGGLPLTQPRAWRHRFHPIVDGLVQRYSLAFRVGMARRFPEMSTAVWRWAWAEMRPRANPGDVDAMVKSTMDVLSGQVRTVGDQTGVPLEDDAVAPTGAEDRRAVLGFVGANTDAGLLLLRVGARVGGPTGSRMRRQGIAILDTFSRMTLSPPAAEGFDTVTGAPATYRTFRERPAVYARSLAEGCLAVLRAADWERGRGTEHPQWRRWARAGGDWLLSQQHPDGSVPRAWVAGTGEVLDRSRSAGYVVVPFLVELARTTGDARFLEGAARAAAHAWGRAGDDGSFSGATLDNPDVLDKEAAILSAEAFVSLYDATGDPVWLDRAEVAASLAETWTYLWDVAMPDDADDSDLHWKRGVPTVGHQLITTGASMTDGFLAVNAAVFARLWEVTRDPHWLEVARLVTHGATAMLGLPGRTFDLRGPGWQQEHWCFGGRRGYGLNRRWLVWVPVAHVWGVLRLEDLGSDAAEAVLGMRGRR